MTPSAKLGNSNELESAHIYGKALDFDAGIDSEATSKRNHAIYFVGEDSLSATYTALYDSTYAEFTDIDRNHNTKPPNFKGSFYKKGHLGW